MVKPVHMVACNPLKSLSTWLPHMVVHMVPHGLSKSLKNIPTWLPTWLLSPPPIPPYAGERLVVATPAYRGEEARVGVGGVECVKGGAGERAKSPHLHDTSPRVHRARDVQEGGAQK